jgi:glutathione S-transferase
MTEPILFGAAYSVYVRAARLALAEKRIPYRLIEVDIFAPEGPPPDYVQRHPFKRIPAFEHEGFRLYETGAITRYIDEVFAGPPLMPTTPRRARVNQIVSIMDNYAYVRCPGRLRRAGAPRRRVAARTKQRSRPPCRGGDLPARLEDSPTGGPSGGRRR